MNTFSYLSSLFSPRPSDSVLPPSPPSPSCDSSPAPSSDTLYLSARSRPGQAPHLSLSLTAPPHLAGLARPYEGLYASPADVPLPDSPVLGGDELWEKGARWEEGEEDREGERRLEAKAVAELEAWGWRRRVGLSIYIFLRHLLSFLPTLAQTRPLPSPPTPTPTTDVPDDKDELLTSLSTPPLPPPRSFFLRRTPPPPSRSASPAHPPRPPRLTPKTLVLDLDETLIHSTSRPYNNGARHGLKVRVVEVVLEGRSTVYTVYKRPWVDFFLRKVRVRFLVRLGEGANEEQVSTWYTVIIFTASLPEYADPVIDWLDGGDGGGGMVGGRLFRSVGSLS